MFTSARITGWMVALATAGRVTRPASDPLLFNVPLVIRGLNARCQSAVWRGDRDYLEYFSSFHDEGLVTFDADKSVDFYAGNIATCDPALFMEVIAWNATEAHFRLNNPTPATSPPHSRPRPRSAPSSRSARKPPCQRGSPSRYASENVGATTVGQADMRLHLREPPRRLMVATGASPWKCEGRQ